MHYAAAAAILSSIVSYNVAVKTSKKEDPAVIKFSQEAKQVLNDNAIIPHVYNIKLNDAADIMYSSLHKAPLAVHERLTQDNLVNYPGAPPAKRGSWKTGPAFGPKDKGGYIPSYFGISDQTYKLTGLSSNFGYDRGHMAGAGNYAKKDQKDSTFILENAIPQNASDNQGSGAWNHFEQYCRSLIRSKHMCDQVDIVSGPIYYSGIKYVNKEGEAVQNVFQNKQMVFALLTKQDEKTLKENTDKQIGQKAGIIVPPKLYKIIVCTKDGKPYGSAFQFLNADKNWRDPQNRYDISIGQYQIDIKDLEKKTGLVFNMAKSFAGKLTSYDREGSAVIVRQMNDKFSFKEVKGTTSLRQAKEFMNEEEYEEIKIFDSQKSMVSSAQNINELRQLCNKACEQNHQFDPCCLEDKIRNQTRKEFNKLQEMSGTGKTDCFMLYRYLHLYQDVAGIKNFDPSIYKDEFQHEIKSRIQPCLQSDDVRYKWLLQQKIGQSVPNQYPFHAELQESFNASN